MRPAVTAWLEASGHTVTYETMCWCMGYSCDIVGARFAPRTGRAIPPVDSCIAVELKLTDIAGVIHQARSNRAAVRLSYAAMPAEFCRKMRPDSLDKFRAAGVGLLAVDGGEVTELVAPVPQPGVISERLRKLVWRRREARFEKQSTC